MSLGFPMSVPPGGSQPAPNGGGQSMFGGGGGMDPLLMLLLMSLMGGAGAPPTGFPAPMGPYGPPVPPDQALVAGPGGPGSPPPPSPLSPFGGGTPTGGGGLGQALGFGGGSPADDPADPSLAVNMGLTGNLGIPLLMSLMSPQAFAAPSGGRRASGIRGTRGGHRRS